MNRDWTAGDGPKPRDISEAGSGRRAIPPPLTDPVRLFSHRISGEKSITEPKADKSPFLTYGDFWKRMTVNIVKSKIKVT